MNKRSSPMKNKRAQAALEFLSTYGFAFLIILVMVGALTYFGVLRPDRLIPDRCQFPAGLNCLEAQLLETTPGTDATLNFRIENQLGNTITFRNQATLDAANSTLANGDCTIVGNAGGGAVATATCLVTGTLPAQGSKVKFLVTIGYQELGKTYWVPAVGEILATLQ